jgi:hypothetical protein
VVLSLASPVAGDFVGDGAIVVEGTVTPPDSAVFVAGRSVVPDASGAFRVDLPFPSDVRATLVDVQAADAATRARALVPVFSGADPRETTTWGVDALLTPEGLDAFEPAIEAGIAASGWEASLLASLSPIENATFGLVPTAVTSESVDVALDADPDGVGLRVTVTGLTLASDLTVGGATYPIALRVDAIVLGGQALPRLDAGGLLTLEVPDVTVDLGTIGLTLNGTALPDWLAAVLLQPTADLVSGLADGLAGGVLAQLDGVALGGPFATEVPVGDATLGVRWVEVSVSADGVGLGATLALDAPAPESMPDGRRRLPPATPSGLAYDVGFAIDEGMLSVLLDEGLGDALAFDLPLAGPTGEILGSGVRALPGGDQVPGDAEGFCLSLHGGMDRVVRMEEGTGTPLARVWVPDLAVDLQVVRAGACAPWLETAVSLSLDLEVSGTVVAARPVIHAVHVRSYGAEGARWDDTAVAVADLVGGLVGLVAGQLRFDLADLAGPSGAGLVGSVVAVEPVEGAGWGVFLDLSAPTVR